MMDDESFRPSLVLLSTFAWQQSLVLHLHCQVCIMHIWNIIRVEIIISKANNKKPQIR
jgi:hypothetical protein